MTSDFAVGGLVVIAYQSVITVYVEVIINTLLSPNQWNQSSSEGNMMNTRNGGREKLRRLQHRFQETLTSPSEVELIFTANTSRPNWSWHFSHQLIATPDKQTLHYKWYYKWSLSGPKTDKSSIQSVPCLFQSQEGVLLKPAPPGQKGTVWSQSLNQQVELSRLLIIFESWSLWPSNMSNQIARQPYDSMTSPSHHLPVGKSDVMRTFCLSTGIMFVSVQLCWTVSVNERLSLALLVGWLRSDVVHHNTLIFNQGTRACLGRGKPADDIIQLHGQLSGWVRWMWADWKSLCSLCQGTKFLQQWGSFQFSHHQSMSNYFDRKL